MADHYLIPGTIVLKNKHGIADYDELAQREFQATALQEMKLRLTARPTPTTLAGLKGVHKALFQDSYEWAGEIRDIFIWKNDDSGTEFSAPDSIVRDVAAALKTLERMFGHVILGGRALSELTDSFADAYIALNNAHPFREGNGRTLRAYFSLAARRHGLNFDWKKVPHEDHVKAAVEAAKGDPTLMRKHFSDVVCYYKAPVPAGKAHSLSPENEQTPKIRPKT